MACDGPVSSLLDKNEKGEKRGRKMQYHNHLVVISVAGLLDFFSPLSGVNDDLSHNFRLVRPALFDFGYGETFLRVGKCVQVF
jgi:hypothetical protein